MSSVVNIYEKFNCTKLHWDKWFLIIIHDCLNYGGKSVFHDNWFEWNDATSWGETKHQNDICEKEILGFYISILTKSEGKKCKKERRRWFQHIVCHFVCRMAGEFIEKQCEQRYSAAIDFKYLMKWIATLSNDISFSGCVHNNNMQIWYGSMSSAVLFNKYFVHLFESIHFFPVSILLLFFFSGRHMVFWTVRVYVEWLCRKRWQSACLLICCSLFGFLLRFVDFRLWHFHWQCQRLPLS